MPGAPGGAPGIAPPGTAPGIAPPGTAPGIAPPGTAPGTAPQANVPPGTAPATAGTTPPGTATPPAAKPATPSNNGRPTLLDDVEPKQIVLADASGGTKSDAKTKFTGLEFSKAFKADPDKFLAKYKTEKVELTGGILGVGYDVTGGCFLTVQGLAEDFIHIQCNTTEDNPWTKAKPGQTVRLEGTPGQALLGLGMKKCKILNVAGTPWKTYTAADLSRAYQIDSLKIGERFDGRHVGITGEVSKVAPATQTSRLKVFLKTPEGSSPVCFTGTAFSDYGAKLKPGQSVLLYGRSPDRYGDEITLDESVIGEAGAAPAGAPGTTPATPGDGKIALFEDDETGELVAADVSGGPKTAARFKLTSQAAAAEFAKGEEAFKKKYDKKKVEITGVVVSLTRGFSEETDALELEGFEDKENFRSYTVNIQTGKPAPWRLALPGQTIRVTGTMGSLVGPAMTQCKIEKVAGDAWKARSAEDLSLGFAADAAKAEAKFKDRMIPISGEVAKVVMNDVKAATVTLKTPDGGKPLDVIFPAWEEKGTSRLKPGDKIKLVGRAPALSDDRIQVFQCLLGGIE